MYSVENPNDLLVRNTTQPRLSTKDPAFETNVHTPSIVIFRSNQSTIRQVCPRLTFSVQLKPAHSAYSLFDILHSVMKDL